MRRVLVLVLGCLLAILAVYLFFRGRPAKEPSLAPGAPEEAAAPAVEPVLVPAAGRAARAVSGRVLDQAQKPLIGAQVVCASEEATTGAGGSFELRIPPLEGPLSLSVRVDGKEAARLEDLLAGDGGAGSGGAQPDRLRVTLNLCAHGQASPAGAKRVAGAFPPIAEVGAVLFIESSPAHRVLIDGATPLPDGAHLDATLYFDGQRVVSSVERAEARGGRFRAQIQFPEELKVHSMTYQLHLVFGVSLEDPLDVERFAKDSPQLPWDKADGLETVLDVFAGDPAEELKENLETERYYEEALDTIESLRRILFSWSKKASQLSGVWDPEVLPGLAASSEAWFSPILLDRSGKLDLGAWRRFLDEGFRPEVRGLLARHQARTGGKFRSAELLLEEALRHLLLLSRIESVVLYNTLGLPADPQDFFLDAELPEGDRVILLQIFERGLKDLQRFRNLTGRQPAEAPQAR